jgi:hypothetical protein
LFWLSLYLCLCVLAYFPHLCLLSFPFFHRPFILSCVLSLSLPYFHPLLLLLIQQSRAISKFSTAVLPVLVLHVDYSKSGCYLCCLCTVWV